MIRKIRLVNIENHLNTEITLNSGINMITGVTDAGKSVILRAILAIFNRGEMVLHFEKSKGYIEVELDNCKVRRTREEELDRKTCANCSHKFEQICQTCPSCGHFQKRKKVDDYYEVNGKRSLRTGIEVPPDIAELFNTDLLQLDDGSRVSVNFFEKNEVPSFVDLKASQRMSIIGSVGEDLVLLDEKLKRNYKDLKSTKASNRESIKIQKSLQKRLSKLAKLDDLKDEVNIIEELKRQWKENEDKRDELFSMLKDINRIEQLLILYEGISEVEKLEIEDFQEIQDICERIKENQKARKAIPELPGVYKFPQLQEISDVLKRIETTGRKQKNLSQVSTVKKMDKDFKKVAEVQEIIVKLNNQIDIEIPDKINFDIKLYEILHEMKELEFKHDMLEEQVDEKKEELNGYQEELAGIETCPLCEQGLSH